MKNRESDRWGGFVVDFEKMPDMKKLYCVCNIHEESVDIELLAKQGNYHAIVCAHSLDEAQLVARILQRRGVDVSSLETCISELEIRSKLRNGRKNEDTNFEN